MLLPDQRPDDALDHGLGLRDNPGQHQKHNDDQCQPENPGHDHRADEPTLTTAGLLCHGTPPSST